MPRSSTTVLDLNDEKGQLELRPRGPSAMLHLSPYLKDAFEKFEQDFLASNLPEGKYIRPPALTAKWYKVRQPCFEDKLQELNSDFAKICISPKPSRAPMGKVPSYTNTKLGRISQPSTLQLPLQRLLPLVTLLWRSIETVLSLPSKGLKARFRRVPILKKLPGMAMKKPVSTLRS